MSKDGFEYYCADDFLNSKEIEEINHTLISNTTTKSVDRYDLGSTKTCKVYSIPYSNVKNSLIRIKEAIDEVNKKSFGFDLYDFDQEPQKMINLNDYSGSNMAEYSWHRDVSNNANYDMKITTIINLSTEEYEGGNFELFIGENKHIVELDKPGSIICFHSWIYHRVTPVVKGIRRSLAIWSNGPLLR